MPSPQPPPVATSQPPPPGSTPPPSASSSSAGTSQWGSFIKRAVTTVEQSLDKVLDPTLATESPAVPITPATDRSGQRISMQQRLALAMQAQKLGSGISRRSTPGAQSSVESSARPSIESSTRPSMEESRPSIEKEPEQSTTTAAIEPPVTEEVTKQPEPTNRTTTPPTPTTTPSVDNQESVASEATVADELPQSSTTDLQQLQSELAQKQEDLHSSVNRVTILEEKVKYLSNQLLEYTEKKPNQNHIDTRLAERDERIALLLLEGETLSKNELKHMTTIKRLRTAEKEAERQAQDAKRRQERAEKEAADLKERLRKANEIERKQSERIKILAKSDSEVDILKRERDTLKTTISDLRDELAQANLLADEAVQKAQTEALDKEKRRAESLVQQLEALKAEHALERERFTHDKFNLQSKLARETDRSKAREHELREEINSLEHKLEMLRGQAEELSAGATGDSQAKMLRQVELLQSQYAIATQNWNGIEASLHSQIANLENERDEVAKRELDLRKKLQAETARARESELEVETVTSRISDIEAELLLQTDVVASLRQRLDEETARSATAIKELEKDKAELEQRLLDEEKANRDETIMQLRSPPALSSPTFSKNPSVQQNGVRNNFPLSRESSYSDWYGSPSAANSISGSNGVPTSIQFRRVSRTARPNVPAIPTGHITSPSHSAGGTPVLSASASFVNLAEMSTASGPQQINLQNSMFGSHGDSADSTNEVYPADDLVSNASTAVGGVSSSERMSTVIRRLSSELASAKEELAILARDRDQARDEIVELLREVKDKREVATKCAELQTQMDELRSREQTTLELLGEKTERVTELENDVADLKMMYRQQIQELIEQINERGK
ncbi:TATA element modulatory factor 1 TATA binding-domain-containing protein [Lipomyces kononenkoae]|uniref:TATA element modulatory factor 1 TATA binding-domain-containing protein n=1 Tax=Lipomyces kononenkoae TaxID=34357 RepID=A0ACC3SWC0_LIPKO